MRPVGPGWKGEGLEFEKRRGALTDEIVTLANLARKDYWLQLHKNERGSWCLYDAASWGKEGGGDSRRRHLNMEFLLLAAASGAPEISAVHGVPGRVYVQLCIIPAHDGMHVQTKIWQVDKSWWGEWKLFLWISRWRSSFFFFLLPF